MSAGRFAFTTGVRAKRARALPWGLTLCLALGVLLPVGVAKETAAAGLDDRTALVTANDGGALLRTEPSYDGDVIVALAEGTPVGLRIAEADTVVGWDGTTRWWPVRFDGRDGWLAGFFLDVDGGGAAAPSAPQTTAAVSSDGGADLTGAVAARVASADGVVLRGEPGSWSAALASLSDGTWVDLRTDQADTVWTEGVRWWPVWGAGQAGWIAGPYLAPAEWTAPAEWAAPAESAMPAAAAPSWPSFGAGAYVAAVTDTGTGVNIRADAAPDAERVGFIPERGTVQVMEGPFWDPSGGGWYLVTDGGVTGFATAAWLVAAEAPAAAPAPPAPAPEPEPAPVAAGVANGYFIYPTNGRLTQYYGCSPYWFEPWNPGLGCNYHNGIDLANVAYTPVVAADGGVVTAAGWCDCGLGFYATIDHGNGFSTTYGHLAEQPWVYVGQPLSQGQVVGPMGSTGNSTGPHLHFIVKLNNFTVDPLAYL